MEGCSIVVARYKLLGCKPFGQLAREVFVEQVTQVLGHVSSLQARLGPGLWVTTQSRSGDSCRGPSQAM